MKKEQLLTIIGESPDSYIQDARTAKRHRSSWPVWVSGMAAILAIVLMFGYTPNIPLSVSAKEISAASEYRKMATPSEIGYARWDELRTIHDTTANSAKGSIAEFSNAISRQVLSGSSDANVVWSPINAYIALAMSAELTGGETQEQILQILHAEETETLRAQISAVWEDIYHNDDREISILANSLWLDQDVTYVQETMDLLAHDYYASVYQGDLGSDKTNRAMTNWMRNQTGGLLRERTGKIQLSPEEQVLTIASTVYFQSKWGDAFSASDSKEGLFHANCGDIEVTYMRKREKEMSYHWTDTYSAVEIRLKNGSVMWFFLPDEGKTVDDVLSDSEYMNWMTQQYPDLQEGTGYQYVKLNLSVPRFDISSTTDLKEALRENGFTLLFEPHGDDFSPSIASAAEQKDSVCLDSICQNTRVKIDEDGVVAASYLELDFGAKAAEPATEIIDFILDRPFVFGIAKDQVPLFVGTVNVP